MRTEQDVVKRVKNSNDIFGFDKDILLPFLSFDLAKEFLKEEATEEEWVKVQSASSEEAVLNDVKKYMEFAWEKVSGHRGISADRSVTKMKTWMWLLGNDELECFADVEINYRYYGAPILAKICKHYGWSIPTDGLTENMIKGKPCCFDCERGC